MYLWLWYPQWVPKRRREHEAQKQTLMETHVLVENHSWINKFKKKKRDKRKKPMVVPHWDQPSRRGHAGGGLVAGPTRTSAARNWPAGEGSHAYWVRSFVSGFVKSPNQNPWSSPRARDHQMMSNNSYEKNLVTRILSRSVKGTNTVC